MKKRIPAFLAGMLTTALICGLTVSALAANGLLNIDVDPSITIKVNGEVFKPKNEQGEDVMVFTYKGTTYAPVRALAKAYGLTVGYDGAANMATVDGVVAPTTPAPDNTAPTDYSNWTPEEEAAYQEFKGMWEIAKEFEEGTECMYKADYIGDISVNTRDGLEEKQKYIQRLANELRADETQVNIYFVTPFGNLWVPVEFE